MEDKKKFQDVFKLKSMKKEMNLEEKAAVLRAKVKEAKKKEKRSLPALLSGQKYEEPEIPLKLGKSNFTSKYYHQRATIYRIDLNATLGFYFSFRVLG